MITVAQITRKSGNSDGTSGQKFSIHPLIESETSAQASG